MEEKYETIKEKIRKLHKLVEQGESGEAQAARLAIERIVANYGMSLEEILEDDQTEEYMFECSNVREDNLLCQCAGYVLNTWKPCVMYSARKPQRKYVKLTKLQYAELKSMYDWHRANMKREYDEMNKLFVSVYISKHNIYPDDQNGEHVDKIDYETARKIVKMQGVMSDKSYHKQLEQGGSI